MPTPLPIRITRQSNARPRVLRPSFMASFAQARARSYALEQIGGLLGTVRCTFGWALQHSKTREEFLDRARAVYRDEIAPFVARGARVIAGIDGTPRWLSRAPQDASNAPGSGWPRYATQPCERTKLGDYGKLVAELAAICGPEVWFELWNEPASPSFWAGTVDELFEQVGVSAAVLRAAGRRVVGLANGSWFDPCTDGDPRPLLQRFIASGVPFDGVSWHAFQSDPSSGLEGADRVREWLRDAGRDPKLPQFVTEWQRWTTFPDDLDPSRDTALGAAHHARALDLMARAGIEGATVACLQGFADAPLGAGSWGLLTSEGPALMREKPAFDVQRILGTLGEVSFGAHVAPKLEKAGVGIFAGERAALVYRFDPLGPPLVTAAVFRAPTSAGFPLDLERAAVHRLEL